MARVVHGGRSEYKQSYKGVGEMLRSKMLQQDMGRRAVRVEAKAISITASEGLVRTGDYLTSFKVTMGIRPGRKPRACGTVTNTSNHSFFIEFGNRNINQHRVLGRALSAAGGDR